MKVPAFLLCLLFLLSCQEQGPARGKASSFDLPAPELGEVWTTKHEEQTQRILAITKDMVQDRAGEAGVHRRDAHPKAHGCVKAQFKVHSSALPAEQRVGLFSEDKDYEAWIRFSNGGPDGDKVHDSEKDVRGMAVKVMNTAGHPSGSHDFLMINSREFFSKDGDDYMRLFQALTSDYRAAILWYGITSPISAKRLLSARVAIGNPLKHGYHSSVIYKLGNRSMRFRATPCTQMTDDSVSGDLPPNFLQKRIVSHLSKQSACFNFYVQPNREPKKNPVEDPRSHWKESKSPLIHVATINVPVQSGIDSREQMNFCENLSFDPWRSHPDNRPLGQINRMRNLIYREISQFRHEQNRIPLQEPKNHHPCSGGTSELCRNPKI